MKPENFRGDYLRKQPLYHFTDVENLPSIQDHGILPYRELRTRGIPPKKPGGDAGSRQSDDGKGLDRFVHLCLKSEHPMEYRARNEGRIGQSRFLEIDPEVLLWDGIMGCVIASNSHLAKILPLESALDAMDLEVLYWKHPAEVFSNPALRQRYNEARKAEILIPACIPPSKIWNLR